MDQYSLIQSRIPLVLCTFILISLLFFIHLILSDESSITTAITRKLYPSKSSPSSSSIPNKTMMMYRDELDAALEGASKNKTVIIVIVNKAYATEEDDQAGDYKPSMLDVFLNGFWVGEDTRHLTNHLLIVAVDQTAYERCMFLRLHCYKLKTDQDGGGEKVYMSEDFIKMMWQRTRFLRDVLRRGYSFLFTDADVLWLRNPFPKLTQNDTVDLQFSVDRFNRNQWSQKNPINTGFYMIKSNNKTIALFDEWYGQRNNSRGKKEQDVLVELMRKRAFRRLKLRVKFLDTNYFSGFCQNSKDASVVTTVHANCCRSIRAKVADLIAVIHDWKRFNNPSRNKTMEFKWTKHLACQNSWSHEPSVLHSP